MTAYIAKPAQRTEQSLVGIKEIVEYAGLSEKVIRNLIVNSGFPAAKIGGTWVSDKDLINDWRRETIIAQSKDRQKI